MNDIDVFLDEVRLIPDPKVRLSHLMAYPDGDDLKIKTELAWWNARYYFTDRKKTNAADRFVWFFLCLSAGRNKSIFTKQTLQAYNEAFLSPQIEEAVALDDRMREEILSAAILFITTMTPQKSILGFAQKPLDKQVTLDRMAEAIAGQMIPRAFEMFRELPFAPLIISGIYNGAQIVYPGILLPMRDIAKNYGDDLREFMQLAVGS